MRPSPAPTAPLAPRGTTTNIATADSAQTDPVSTSATVVGVVGPPIGDPGITKGVSATANGTFGSSLTVAVGTKVFYRITVTNNGTEPLTGITLSDDRTDLVAAGCTIPTTLSVGASFTCAYSVVAGAGTVRNTATVDTAESGPASAYATVTGTSTPNPPSLAITKGVRSSPTTGAYTSSVTVFAGTTVYYRITVTNNGAVALSGITLTDDLTDLVVAHCAIPTALAVSASFTCVYSAIAALGPTTNTATANSHETDHPETASATVVGLPSGTEFITISKGVATSASGPFGSNVTVYEGSTVWYRITVTNIGSSTASSVTLTDSLVDLVAAHCVIPTTLAVNASFTCTYSAVAVRGTTHNTATADSAQTVPVRSSATVVGLRPPILSITKGVRADPTAAFVTDLVVPVGTTVTYRITVTTSVTCRSAG